MRVWAVGKLAGRTKQPKGESMKRTVAVSAINIAMPGERSGERYVTLFQSVAQQRLVERVL